MKPTLRKEVMYNIIEAPLTEGDTSFLLGDIMVNYTHGKSLREFLERLPKRQAYRFWEVCYREDDLGKWVEFLEYESFKETSAWGHEIVRELAKKLVPWWNDEEPTRGANQKFNGELDDLRGDLQHLSEVEKIIGELKPTSEELKEWKRNILCKVLGNILRG
ncbi:hypothetical protein HKBW3S03_01819 [Candidatus Hakubella thermalkaliphila]|uniref:Uncharacterized protein n=1 Tax=Candidatus Hakubella thermalkaliphila TaxID=2754717 RepID=A0A6V8PDW0_9ACTN|nr:hypothetical protein [Candidatus Hakubella thermalkaliphila]MBT9167072.1 hypothetical protein [Bacillota bacterium]GFP20317.1 hypothetical protein HKBW3S03_01819 [Candidatus Hakubella thermalkaliphila]GFP30899.1 hypothetical protein HKBW3S34_01818 [Candidatus Hakubella thermalkaliphila]GFP39433.1 hypothetical protein HKBW3S47_01132 [Candidatus Hakubella thermalkaliphila]GFP43057.1 hypothetical protein HKBW3C_02189 [Candidatus Hakubella thermalkaliphila]